MKGFFPESDLKRKAPIPVLAQCGKCGLYKTCITDRMKVSGKGKKGLLVVGEAPGRTEDEQGKPFVGSSGQLVQETLLRYGIELRRDCWVTNAVICRPPNNSLPPKAITYCQPNLIQTVKDLQPTAILVLGNAPLKSLVGWLWKEDPGGITRWSGQQIPSQQLNAWVCPTFHPSYLLHERKGEGRNVRKNEALELYFDKHFQAFSELKGRPWEVVPKYEQEVKIYHDPDQAIPAIKSFLNGGPIAFDWETDRSKADSSDSTVLCIGISNENTTIAFPWNGPAVGVAKELLASDIPKIGWNIRFEQRWARRQGITINNWKWDGMLVAHAMDSRRGTKGLEYQSFVVLGHPSYKDLSYLMKTDGGYDRNRLHEASKKKLLTYCGTDALLEWHIAQKQMGKLGVSI